MSRAALHRRRLVSFVAIASLVAGGLTATEPLATAVAQPVAQAADQSPSPVTSRPDLVSARIAAVSQGSRVEVTGLDDEYSTTYVNPDGTETTDTSQTPLRIMQGGSWTPVDYSLEHVDGGWQPKASPVPVVFSDGNDADAADVGSGGKEVDLSWDVTLPKPTVDGANATYDLGDGESLVLTATATGFEQSLVLQHAPTSLPHIKLPLDTSNLSMTSDGNGGFLFQNPAGDDVYQMPGPVMYGADIDPTTGEPAQSKPVSADLVQTDDGPQLDLTPSLTWLQDPSVTYPVTIDPSVSSVTRGGDTYIQDNVTTSQAGSIYLHAGEFGGHAARSFLMFSGVSSLAGDYVNSASLQLWNNGANSCTAATMHVYALTSAFAYNNTWTNTKPTWTTTDAGSKSFANGISGCQDAQVTIPLQGIVQDWANGQTNDGLQLSGTETVGSQGWGFCSMDPDTSGGSSCGPDSGHEPTLSVTYTPPPDAVDSVSFAQQGSRATIDWLASDSANATSYRVASSPATTQGTLTVTSTSATFTSLASGTSYGFSVQACNAAGCAAAVQADQVPATPPTAPVGVQLTDDTNGNMIVSWGAPSSAYDDQPNSITVFDVQLLSGSTVVASSSVGADSQTSTLTGAQSGQAYTASVAAENSFGVGVPAASNTQIGFAPSQIANLAADPGPGSLSVSWATPSLAPQQYVVSALPQNGGSTAQQTVSGSGTSTTLTGLSNDDAYLVQVSASNTAGTTTATSSAEVSPEALPAAPADVTASGLSSQSMQVSWTEPTATTSDETLLITIKDASGSTVGTTEADPDEESTVVDDLGSLGSQGPYTAYVSNENVAGDSPAVASNSAPLSGNQDTDASDYGPDDVTDNFLDTHAELEVPSSQEATFEASQSDSNDIKSDYPTYEPADADDTSQDTSLDNPADAAGSLSGCATSSHPNCTTDFYLTKSPGQMFDSSTVYAMGEHQRKMSDALVLMSARGFCKTGADLGDTARCTSWSRIAHRVKSLLRGWVESRPVGKNAYRLDFDLQAGNGGADYSPASQSDSARHLITAANSVLVKYAETENKIASQCAATQGLNKCKNIRISIKAGLDEESGFNSAYYSLSFNDELNSLQASGDTKILQWNNVFFQPLSDKTGAQGWSLRDMYDVVWGIGNATAVVQNYDPSWGHYEALLDRYARKTGLTVPSYHGVLWQCDPGGNQIQSPGQSWDKFKGYTGQSTDFLMRQAVVGAAKC